MSDAFSLPFVNDAEGCSAEGAALAAPKAKSQTAVVYSAIQQYGPLSDLQIAEKTGYPINVICARRWALVKQGLVRSAGTIRGASGARNTVWEVARG